MSITVAAKTYNKDAAIGPNSVGYVGPAKTVTIKDDLVLNRTAPKPTATFSGVGRSTSKLTRTLTLTGALTTSGQVIVEINVSAPVGAASADVQSAVDDMAALMASATYNTLVDNAKIEY